MPGMEEERDGAMQQAPHPIRHTKLSPMHQFRDKRGNRGLNTQDPVPDGDWQEAAGNKFVYLVRDKSSFGADSEGHSALKVPRTGLRCGAMGHKGKRSGDEPGQFVCHKGLEQRAEKDLGKNSDHYRHPAS